MAYLAAAGIGLQVYGMMDSRKAARKEAARRQLAANMAAADMEMEATQALAQSQLIAKEQSRQFKIMTDQVRVMAAAQGGSADPSVVQLVARSEGEGAYRAARALYEGESRARSLRRQAQIARVTGDLQAATAADQGRASLIEGSGRLFQMGTSLYDRFNKTDSKPETLHFDP